MQYLKELLTAYKPHKEDLNIHVEAKQIYTFIFHKTLTNSKIGCYYPNVNWPIIWKSLLSFSRPFDKNIIFTCRYIHGIVPDGPYLVKYRVIDYIPDCTIWSRGQI